MARHADGRHNDSGLEERLGMAVTDQVAFDLWAVILRLEGFAKGDGNRLSDTDTATSPTATQHQ